MLSVSLFFLGGALIRTDGFKTSKGWQPQQRQQQNCHFRFGFRVCVSVGDKHVFFISSALHACTSSDLMMIHSSCALRYSLDVFALAYARLCRLLACTLCVYVWTAGQLTPQRGWISISNYWHGSACLLTAASLPRGSAIRETWASTLGPSEEGWEWNLFRNTLRALLKGCLPTQHLQNG